MGQASDAVKSLWNDGELHSCSVQIILFRIVPSSSLNWISPYCGMKLIPSFNS